MSEDTDGILHPDEPEVAHRDPVLDAFDHWRAQQDLPAWNDLRAALGPAEAEVDDLELAYRALAESSPETREKAVKKLRDLVAASDVEALKPITAVPWDQVEGEAPERLVWLTGRSGALISAGEVTLLAGAGGVGKSALACQLALNVAAIPADADSFYSMDNSLFDHVGGPVLIVALEDSPPLLRNNISLMHRDLLERARGNLHVLDLRGRPVFGPRETTNLLYNSRPGPLAHWKTLWDEAARLKVRLVVIDPTLAAYVGEPNAAAPVREFMSHLATEARRLETGVLLLAHSTKAARKGSSPKPPTQWEALNEVGHVGGSAAWFDAARGVLNLVRLKDRYLLTVPKANYGPAYLVAEVEPRHGGDKGDGPVVGFQADSDGWRKPQYEPKQKERRSYDLKATS